jgi:hypothetical protein
MLHPVGFIVLKINTFSFFRLLLRNAGRGYRAATLSTTKLGITTLDITTLGIMTLGLTTLGITTLNITKLVIIPFSIAIRVTR